ncbi:MAG TPA: BrnT family toxin [Methylomirabilota bacterium]|nr:BrnT family toxin [Methylomirabilota bacterium]
MHFTWDPAKAAANLKKHRVSFPEAATVLEDPLSTTFPDESHSTGERRFVTIGASTRGRLLVVAHAERDDTIRIVSARRATRRERAFYEQK